jgi:chromosome segregation ATPase
VTPADHIGKSGGLEPRVARLEADVAKIKSILNRLAPRIDQMYGFLSAKLPELATRAEVAELRTETKTEIPAVRTELADLRAETKTEIAGLRSETRTEIAAVRTEMAALLTELKSEIGELRIEIMQRPTRRQTVFDIFSVVPLIGVILTIAARFAH